MGGGEGLEGEQGGEPAAGRKSNFLKNYCQLKCKTVNILEEVKIF